MKEQRQVNKNEIYKINESNPNENIYYDENDCNLDELLKPIN